MRQRFRNTYLILVLAFLLVTPVRATLTIDVNLWLDNATPIAVVPFAWQGKGSSPVNMASVISGDLGRSGRFAPMAESDMVERPSEGREVNYATWRNTKMKYLVVGKVSSPAPDSFDAQFQLLDIEKGSQMIGHSFQVRGARSLRRLAHRISDLIYEAITDERGAFDTYLAYITVGKDAKGHDVYRLAISDSDSENEQILFESNMPIVRPSWSPDGRSLAYVSYATGRPQIYIQDIFTAKTQQLTNFKGSNLSPSWSPDGRRMAMSLSKDGNAEIYIMDLATRRLHRITNSYGADIEVDWMPDGRGLVFTSDRGGRPQIYKVAVDDNGAVGRPVRITFDGKENARPTVSPDGKRIALVNNTDGKYRIAIYDLESEQLSILTEGRLDETPSFAPNGSMLIYAASNQGRGVLAVVSSDGRSSYKFRNKQGDVREPAWSPYKRD